MPFRIFPESCLMPPIENEWVYTGLLVVYGMVCYFLGKLIGTLGERDRHPPCGKQEDCETDYTWELGETDCTTYPSLAGILKYRKCARSCGVVSVDVTFANKKWVIPRDITRRDMKTFEESRGAREERELVDEIRELKSVQKRQRLGAALTKRLGRVELLYELFMKDAHRIENQQKKPE